MFACIRMCTYTWINSQRPVCVCMYVCMCVCVCVCVCVYIHVCVLPGVYTHVVHMYIVTSCIPYACMDNTCQY